MLQLGKLRPREGKGFPKIPPCVYEPSLLSQQLALWPHFTYCSAVYKALLLVDVWGGPSLAASSVCILKEELGEDNVKPQRTNCWC